MKNYKSIVTLSLLILGYAVAVQAASFNPQQFATFTPHATSSPSPSSSSPGGLYVLLGNDEAAIPPRALANPSVDGIALRFSWRALETADGVFNWTPLDTMIAEAALAGKKVSLSVQAGYLTPAWLYSEGVQSIRFVWDQPSGPAICTVQTMPVPWDPTFLQKWTAFVQAFGVRYNSNPAVAQVKLTGLNSKTQETFLPIANGGPINNGQCNSYNDIASWQAAGYTSIKVEAAWQRIAASFAASFPSKPLTAMLVPGGFPPLDASGNPIVGQPTDYQVSKDIIATGLATLGTAFIAQNNGLSSTWVWKPLTQLSKHTTVGFQTVGVMGNKLAATVKLGLASGGRFLEIYFTDVANPSLQATLAAAHQSLLAVN